MTDSPATLALLERHRLMKRAFTPHPKHDAWIRYLHRGLTDAELEDFEPPTGESRRTLYAEFEAQYQA